MTNTSNPKKFPNVPPPQGGTRPASAYTRFIPREELGEFQPWKPGVIGGEPEPEPERRTEPRPEGAPLPTVDEWRAKVAAARQSGYQDGYRDGLVALEGFKQSFAAQMSSQLGALVAAFDEQMSALERQMAEAVSRSSVLLARQVLRDELTTHPEHVARLAQEAVNAVLMSARHIVVRVHPDDHAFVAQGAEETLQARGARLVADPSVTRGGCLIDTDADAIDASVETRWAQARALLGADVPWSESPAAPGEQAPE